MTAPDAIPEGAGGRGTWRMSTSSVAIVIRAVDRFSVVVWRLLQAAERDRILRGELVAPTGRDLSEEDGKR